MFVKKSLHEFESRVLTHLTCLFKRGGKDIFVTVSGDYVKSSFGSSLDALCRLTVPIRDLCDGSIIKLEKGQPASEIPEIKANQHQLVKQRYGPLGGFFVEFLR